MLLATVVLSAALAPQAPPPASPPAAAPAASAVDHPATPPPAAGVADPHLAAGIAAFKKRRFAAARAEFEKAEAADPQSAAAAYYLGYTFYKIGEPSKRMNANKEKAKELFAKAFSLDPAFRPDWGRKQ
jgi:tetratricopeptide (TPR) repeat protein